MTLWMAEDGTIFNRHLSAIYPPTWSNLTPPITATTDDPILFRLPDEPGALAKAAQRFKDAGLNIQSLHILDRRADHAIVALTTRDRAAAESLLDPDSII